MKVRSTGAYLDRTCGFFRIRGYGLWFGIDSRPLFSERNGFRRVYRIGRLAFEVLKP